MQLCEVKNDIAKIVYNPAENHLLPSDFLLIEDLNQKLIAQVVNISTTDEPDNNIADIRLSLAIDKEDNLSYYNGYIPSRTSKILYINPDEIMELIKGSGDTIYFGNLSNHSDCFVKPSISFINDKVYIQSDRDDKTKTVVQNMVSELYQKKKKVVLLDFDGRYNSIYNVPRLKVSDTFKLPLNIEAFNTILEYDIVDCPLEDKAVIQSIVLELREYINTLENKFLPFTLFRNVVDNEFMANPISGLMLLRNKLWLYAQESIFAESKSHFDLINNILEKQDVLVIDASTLDEKWHKFTIQTLVGLIQKHCYLVLSLNDVPMDKKSIISLYNTPNIIPIVSTSYDSNYRALLKSVCKNQILFKPAYLINDEEAYNALLPKMNSGEFILYGESTLYLPMVLELQSFNSSTSEDVIQNEIKKDVDKFLSQPKSLLPQDTVLKQDVDTVVATASKTAEETIENLVDDLEDDDLAFLDDQNIANETITIDDIRKPKSVQPVSEEQYDIFVPMGVSYSEPESILNEDVDDYNKASVLDSIDSDLELINNQESLEIQTIQDNSENLEELLTDVTISSGDDEGIILGDVDNDDIVSDVLAEISSEYVILVQENEETKEEVDVDALLQDDLLLDNNVPQSADDKDDGEKNIDIELESDEQEIQPPPIKEQINTKSSTTLPEYESGNLSEVMINDVPFKIGEKIFHPKYGEGVIEGFANYSNKILFCTIDFDGQRKILDPRISSMQKIQ
ncbi:MAG: hypothetical protein IJY61_08390 [Candidatus Gastranaerophilales bacterium]|nr:hypothetical protein [Candidatus Gastranaerophilales bacterium]